MSKDRGTKKSPEQKLAQERRRLFAAADKALAAAPGAQNAADVYFSLIAAEEDLQDLRKKILDQASRQAGTKRFWTAFGLNTPLVAGLLLLEPVSGTLAVIGAICTGYTPTVLIKRMLDDGKVGDAAAIRSVQMDIESIDILATELKNRRKTVSDQYAGEMLADKDHRLFKHYRELTAFFKQAALRAPSVSAAPKPASKRKPSGI